MTIAITTLLVCVFIGSLIGNYYYPRFALRFHIHAIPNYRSLHETITPRGAGIVVAAADLIAVAIGYGLGMLDEAYMLVFFGGGMVVVLIGFADDRFEIPALGQLIVQILAATWLLYSFGGMPPLGFGSIVVEFGWPGHLLAAFAIVWFFNLFNFMDGVDGMATSGTLYATGAATVMLLINGSYSLALLSAFLCVATAGFIYFNWPPAKVFLGDAGSSFLSYSIAALILASVWSDGMSLWTWLILLGYFVVDTTVTMLVRVIRVKKWYRPHRSHAYQNLARVWGNHLKIVRLVLLIEFFWLLPLAMLSVWNSQIAPAVTAVAFLPIIVFVLRHGPLNADC